MSQRGYRSYRLYNELCNCFRGQWWNLNHYIETNAKEKKYYSWIREKIGYMGVNGVDMVLAACTNDPDPGIVIDKHLQLARINNRREAVDDHLPITWRPPKLLQDTVIVAIKRNPCIASLVNPLESHCCCFGSCSSSCVDRLCWCKNDSWWNGPLYMLLDGGSFSGNGINMGSFHSVFLICEEAIFVIIGITEYQHRHQKGGATWHTPKKNTFNCQEK